jgi:shikimate dehydrogenase
VLAVSLFAEEPRRLRARLRLLEGRVPWVELRLDRAPPELDLGALRAEFPELRFLAAWRPMEPERHAERAAALERAARAGCDALDLPLGAPRPAAWDALKIVHSFHEAPGRSADLAAVLARALAAARRPGAAVGDVIKIVAWADDAENAARVLPLYARAPRGALIAFAMGEGGGATRTWAPALGAPWTYAGWPGEATAPGQLDWRAMLPLLPTRSEPDAPLYGVVGRPIAHSLSPRLWSAALRCEQPDSGGSYAACAARSLSAFLDAHADPRFAACSITAPFKEEAFRLAHAADPAAAACRAANFLLRTPVGWRAANTDGPAALDAMAAAGLARGAPLLLLGAGGAARAAAAEALRRGHPLTVAARRHAAAAALAADLAPLGRLRTTGLSAENWEEFGGVIQATSLGSSAQPGNPADGCRFARGAIALDMVYEPARTAFLAQAEAQGAVAVGGAEMLLRQMLAQYRLARGVEAPVATLRAELAQALRERQPDPRRALVLIGPRAAGKTTLGRALATRLGRGFVDADEELERRSGRRIADWLPSDAPSFRAAEAALLIELLATPGVVVALGGGAVEDLESRRRLTAHGAVLWLHLDAAEQERRRADEHARPALSALPRAAEIAQLHARRLPWYRACADRCVETAGAVDSVLADALSAAAELGVREDSPIPLTTVPFAR